VRRFKNVSKFEVVNGEEDDFGRSGMEVRMNNAKFRVGIGLEIE
jgi:hypothetical protein